jgi:hypothetical protein
MLNRMTIIDHDIVRFQDLQERALKFNGRILIDVGNKQVDVYFLVANLMFGVEKQICELRSKDYR